MLHGSLLCACEPSAWRLVFSQSIAELQSRVEALQPRLPAAGWLASALRVGTIAVISASRAISPSLWLSDTPCGTTDVSFGGICIAHAFVMYDASMRASGSAAVCMLAAGSVLAAQLEAHRDGLPTVKAEQLPAPETQPPAADAGQQLANGHQPAAGDGDAADADMEDADVFAALAALADHAEQASGCTCCTRS